MKIAIAGYGVEGKANYAYWAKDPANELTIVDQRPIEQLGELPEGARVITGEAVFSERLDDFDLVIRTAGLAPYKLQTSTPIWSGTNEFFARCVSPIIGVTGSKGKGTTASLITEILRAAGRKVWFVGNIGTAALEVLDQIQPDDIVVYELSSFQLWDIQASPHVAVVLYIEPEHLDVHRDMEDYVTAKAQITRFQSDSDVLVYNQENQYAVSIAETTNARKAPYPASERASVRDGIFYFGETALCSVETLKIKGVHNQSNALAAITAAWQFTQDAAAISTGLASFKGLEHRLSYVASIGEVAFYDDSIATTVTSAIAALDAFPEVPKAIILGGSSKGADFTELAGKLRDTHTYAVLIGIEGAKIADACKAAGFANFTQIAGEDGADVMARAVADAYQKVQSGGVVLLSPAAASFGLYKNYVDRAEKFHDAVRQLSS